MRRAANLAYSSSTLALRRPPMRRSPPGAAVGLSLDLLGRSRAIVKLGFIAGPARTSNCTSGRVGLTEPSQPSDRLLLFAEVQFGSPGNHARQVDRGIRRLRRSASRT